MNHAHNHLHDFSLFPLSSCEAFLVKFDLVSTLIRSRKTEEEEEFKFSLSSFLGLYGNDDLHNGLLEVLTAGRKVDNLVSSVRNQTNALEHTLTQKIRPQLTELDDIFDEPVSNQTALAMLIGSLEMVKKNITIATNAAGDIRRPLMGISLNHILNVSSVDISKLDPKPKFISSITKSLTKLHLANFSFHMQSRIKRFSCIIQ